MLTTPHAAAGIAIGAFVGNPLVVIPTTMASHFLLDAVPHWQETLAPYNPTRKTYIRVPLDIALAVAMTILATRWQPHYTGVIWLGAIFANVPDLDTVTILIPKLRQGIVRKYYDWHCAIQRETASLWGVVPQLLVIAISLVLVKVR
ncbi:MAG TPA: hypothetical protein VII55_03770 [Candidatus Saccharimonadales bacterium]